ncbi:hypothetical protein ABW19_dt0209731 [Dactylella cylindrospora]|nr:hypothetical protein ABW19_dt0209731 [Dactylella cylindrospora]
MRLFICYRGDLESAKAHVKNEDFDAAYQILNQALQNASAATPAPTGVDPRQIRLIILEELIGVCDAAKNYAGVLSHANEINLLYSSVLGYDNLTTLMSAHRATTALLTLQPQAPVAIELVKLVADGMGRTYGPAHRLTVQSCRHAGVILLDANRPADAERYLSKALNSLVQYWDPNEALVQDCRKLVADALSMLPGRENDAVVVCRTGLSDCRKLRNPPEKEIEWEYKLGVALIRAGSKQEGEQILENCVHRVNSLPKASQLMYIKVLQTLLIYRASPLLSPDTAEASLEDRELLEGVVRLLEPY